MVTQNSVNFDEGLIGQVLTSNGPGVAASMQYIPGTLNHSKITLTSSQIKNLHATPITIIPAQGPNTVIICLGVTAKFIYGGSDVFVAGASQEVDIIYASSGSSLVTPITTIQLTNAFNTFSSRSIGTFLSDQAVGVLDNVSIAAKNLQATEISGNASDDNSIILDVIFFVSTLT